MLLWVYSLWIGWACHHLRCSADVLRHTINTVAHFLSADYSATESFSIKLFFPLTSRPWNYFDTALWWTPVGFSKLLSVYVSKCKRNIKWEYIYLRLIWWKMLAPWRLNVASMCSSQFCLFWFLVPLIFHFWLAALRRSRWKHWKSLDTLIFKYAGFCQTVLWVLWELKL